MAFAWRCRRCKGPDPPIKGGPSEKPWVGPCPNCGGSYNAERVSVPDDSDDEELDEHIQPIKDGEAISMSDAIIGEANNPRARGLVTGSPGLDWVLGGDLPVGIALLIASPQGAGKSTLLVELLRQISTKHRIETFYNSTEESTKQLGRRYARLGRFPHQMQICYQTDILEIVEQIEEKRPRVAVIDSLHELEGVVDSNGFVFSTGSGTAVTLAAKMIKKLADEQEITIFAVAHVTKDGNIAGTNTVQHALDGTLYLSGNMKMIDGRMVIVGPERLLRVSGKYRFGETGRRAYLRMDESGLHDMGPWEHELPPWGVSIGERNAESEQ